MIKDLIVKNRSYRRFYEEVPIELETLRQLVVLALGEPKEKVVIETVGPNGDIKYWRDSEGLHHVPKRALDELIVG